MPVCKDPRLTYLNDLGFNVVRLPRQGIRPLGVLGKDNNVLNYLGTLDQIWDTPNAVPAPGSPNAVAPLTDARTSDIKLSAGLEILANALAGMFGVTAPSVNLEYKNSKALQFKFTEVQTVGIDPFELGNYLSAGDLKSGSPFIARYFSQGDTEAFVITEILQAKSISVIGKDEGGAEVKLDVPALQQVLGVKVAVTAANSAGTEITYTGLEYLTFGFKVFGIGMVNGVWQVHGVKPGAGIAFATSETVPDPILMHRNGLVDLEITRFRSAAG
jgi:hypothetical protein